MRLVRWFHPTIMTSFIKSSSAQAGEASPPSLMLRFRGYIKVFHPHAISACLLELPVLPSSPDDSGPYVIKLMIVLDACQSIANKNLGGHLTRDKPNRQFRPSSTLDSLLVARAYLYVVDNNE